MGYRSGDGPRRGGLIGLGVLLFALAVGIAVWAPSGDGPPVPSDPGTASADLIPAAGDPERVVARWLDGTATRRVLDSPAFRRRLVGDLVAPAARDRMLAELRASAAGLDSDEAAGLVMRALPIGLRVVKRDERSATFEVEQLVMQSVPTDPPAAALATSRIALEHADGWFITSVDVDAVPLAQVPHERLAALDSKFAGFRHVP